MMPQFPTPGSDRNTWGGKLEEWALAEHNPDGTHTTEFVESITEDFAAVEDVEGLQNQIDGHTNDVANPHGVTATQVGLGNVDNTSDADKPVSTFTQAILDQKVDDTQLVGKHLLSDGEWTDIQDSIARVDPGSAGGAGQYATVGPSGPDWIDELHFRVDHPRWGGDFSGGQDVTTALLNAIDAADAATGGWYASARVAVVQLPPGIGDISQLIEVPNYVQLRGCGPRTSVLKATDASAGVSITGSSGQHGWFSLDGDDIGTNGLYLPVANENIYTAINVRQFTQYGIELDNQQNALFLQVNSEQNGGTGYVIDNQSNSNLFLRCEGAGNTDQQLLVAESSGTTNSNLFDTCIFESHSGAMDHQVLITGGTTYFRNVVMTSPATTGNAAILMAKSGTATNCELNISGGTRITMGSGYTGIEIGANCVLRCLDAGPYIAGSGSIGIKLTSSDSLLYGVTPRFGTLATKIDYSGGATQTNDTLNDLGSAVQRITPIADADRALLISSPTYLTSIGADGKIIWSLDTNLYRTAANALRTDDSFYVGINLEISGNLYHNGTQLRFFNVAPVSRASALTQTYNTSDRTLGAYTADTESVAYTGATDGEAKLTDLNALRIAYENLRAHHEDLAQFVNALVDDLQAYGLEQ